ncbi:MAG TPA: thioredoxin family protein [Trueperaceae bacterium]|nr:thioredoxin family protein [Trueperaceae bacterium]
MAFLDAELKQQVADALAPLEHEVELVVYRGTSLVVPGRDQPGEERAMLELAREVAETSDRVTVVEKVLAGDEQAAAAGIALTPTTVFRRKGDESLNVRFAGLMSGYEFSTMLETILMVGGARELDGLEEVAGIEAPLRLRTFVTPTCPYCPRAVLTAFRFALANPRITAEGVEANEFPTLSSRYRISGVPDTVVEGAGGSGGVRATRVLGAQPEPVFVGALKQAVEETLPAAD